MTISSPIGTPMVPQSLEKRLDSLEKRFASEDGRLSARIDGVNARVDLYSKEVSQYRLDLTAQFQTFTKEVKDLLHETQEGQLVKDNLRLARENEELKHNAAEQAKEKADTKKHYTRLVLGSIVGAMIPPIILYLMLAFNNMRV